MDICIHCHNHEVFVPPLLLILAHLLVAKLNCTPYYRHLTTHQHHLVQDCLLLTHNLHASSLAPPLFSINPLLVSTRSDTVDRCSVPQMPKLCPLSLTHYDPLRSIPSLGLIVKRRTRQMHFCATNKTAAICTLIIILSGDVQTNPGPIKYPCGTCQRPVATNHRAMACDLCNTWVHIKCCGMTPREYENFQAQGDNLSWMCPACVDRQSNTSASSESVDSLDYDSSDNEHTSTPPLGHAHTGRKQEGIRLAVINTASIKGRRKAGEFKAYIANENPDIIVACETNLTAAPNMAC